MKKNLGLFSLLVALLIVVYFVEERGERERIEKESREGLIFDPEELGEIVQFKTEKVTLVKEKTGYMVYPEKFPADPSKIDQVFSIFSKIKIERTMISEELNKMESVGRKYFFPPGAPEFTFVFERGEVRFTLGKKLKFSQSFYLEIVKGEEKQWVVVKDAGALPYAYSKKNEHRSADRYIRFKGILYLPSRYYFDGRLFSPVLSSLSFKKWKRIKVQNIRNRPLMLYLESRTTSPEILSGLSYNQSFFDVFRKSLVGLNAKEVIFLKSKDIKLSDQVSSIKIYGDDQEVTLFLYRKYGKESGYFINISNRKNVVYRFEKSLVTGLFFSNVQDFWDKKAKLSFLAEGAYNLEMALSFPKVEDITLTLVKEKSFSVANVLPKRMVASIEQFKLLVDLLKRQADRVSHHRSKQFNQPEQFSFKLWSRKFSIHYDGQELTLFDRANWVGLHYMVGDSVPIGLKWRDFFHLEKK